MNASHTDHPRRSPVAFLWNRSPVLESADVLVAMDLLLLSAREHEPLDLLAAVEVYNGPEELPLLVGAARVDTEGPADPGVAPRLVDVPVQREGRLALLYGLPDRGGADGHRRAAGVLGAHILGDLRGVVEAGAVGRAVEVVDGPPGRGRHLARHP